MLSHVRDADARTARNTAVNWVASSMPGTMRTTAPASLTSIVGDAVAARATGAGSGTSVMIGTKSGATVSVDLAVTLAMFWHAARRQPNTCCEQTCQRLATSDTRAPGPRLSSTIRAFSSADHAMTSHADGRSDGHGALFMGVYVRLIERYLRLDPQLLIGSLRDAGIEIACDAQPVFVDP